VGRHLRLRWGPVFNPATGQVAAPVRKAGAWGMAIDDVMAWDPKFAQLWHQAYAPDGSRLAAIVAPSFGAFTVAVDGTPWAATFPVVTDLVISATGGHVAALGSNDNTAFAVLCDGKVWGGRYDMAWKPVFRPMAPIGRERGRGGVHTVVCDGKAYPKSFEKCFAPAFSPDGTKVLIRGIEGGRRIGSWPRWKPSHG